MAQILVRYKKNNQFRMWNTTCDFWETPIMDYETALVYCFEENLESTRKPRLSWIGAFDWINRVGYEQDHLTWLDKHYDSNIDYLNALDRKIRRADKKHKQGAQK